MPQTLDCHKPPNKQHATTPRQMFSLPLPLSLPHMARKDLRASQVPGTTYSLQR